jgi:plasmid stabilization system protein ParE
MRLEFHPSTTGDVREATRHYDSQRAGLGARFLLQLDQALAQIARNPHLFPVVEHEVRRALVKHFPYTILFRVLDGDTVRILVIRHHRRDPRFGGARR